MNRDMFGTLPDGSLYTKRRNLWTRPHQNVVTYEGYECKKITCGLKQTNFLFQLMLEMIGRVGRETHFTVSFDYIYIERQRGTTNPMSKVYCDGSTTDSASSGWFGTVDIKGNRNLIPGSGWKHHTYTFAFNVDKGKAYYLNIYPVFLRDVDADLYIRNIMVTYGDEDYPYTPAPEIDPTVVFDENLFPYTIPNAENFSKIESSGPVEYSKIEDNSFCFKVAADASKTGYIYPTDGLDVLQTAEKLIPNQVYTYQYDVWTSVDHSTDRDLLSHMQCRKDAKDLHCEEYISITPSTVKADTWTHVTVKFKTSYPTNMRVFHLSATKNAVIKVKNHMLTIGEEIYPYSPSPQELAR